MDRYVMKKRLRGGFVNEQYLKNMKQTDELFCQQII